jgi:hypothetical protein
MDSRKCQTATATPAEPGELPLDQEMREGFMRDATCWERKRLGVILAGTLTRCVSMRANRISHGELRRSIFPGRAIR